jgi:hypothetical protein
MAAPGNNGREEHLRFQSREYKNILFWGFFQQFQQCISCFLSEVLCIFNDHYTPLSLKWSKRRSLLQDSNLLNLDESSIAPDPQQVGMMPIFHLPARGT